MLGLGRPGRSAVPVIAPCSLKERAPHRSPSRVDDPVAPLGSSLFLSAHGFTRYPRTSREFDTHLLALSPSSQLSYEVPTLPNEHVLLPGVVTLQRAGRVSCMSIAACSADRSSAPATCFSPPLFALSCRETISDGSRCNDRSASWLAAMSLLRSLAWFCSVG